MQRQCQSVATTSRELQIRTLQGRVDTRLTFQKRENIIHRRFVRRRHCFRRLIGRMWCEHHAFA